jgi:hypothetical protein
VENNKGYVFTPLMLVLLIVITIVIVSFKQTINSSNNELLINTGLMDNILNNHSKTNALLVDGFKEQAYSNISNYSTISLFNQSIGGLLNSNNPVISFYLSKQEYSLSQVNMTFPAQELNISLNYPLSDIILAADSFNQQLIQQCLYENNCSVNRAVAGSLLVNCLSSIKLADFNIRNQSVPLLLGSDLYADLALFNEGMTLLYPYFFGCFVFSC